jgi:hypothetical protein
LSLEQYPGIVFRQNRDKRIENAGQTKSLMGKVYMINRALSYVLFIFLFLSASVAMQPRETMLLQQSRYDELEDYLKNRIQDPEAVPFSQLFYLCYTHSKVRRYDKLFPCLWKPIL